MTDESDDDSVDFGDYEEGVAIVVSDWRDEGLLPREAADLKFRAEVSRTGRCKCGGSLQRVPAGFAFVHRRLCYATDARSEHITKKMLERHGRVPRSRVILGSSDRWLPVVDGHYDVVPLTLEPDIEIALGHDLRA